MLNLKADDAGPQIAVDVRALSDCRKAESRTVRLREKKMKKLIWAPLLLAIAAFTAGCNTIEGAGKDIERGGEKLQQQAR